MPINQQPSTTEQRHQKSHNFSESTHKEINITHSETTDCVLPIPRFPYAPSAELFMARVDAIAEITAVHPIWLEKDADDDFDSIDDIRDEVFNDRYPIRLDSKSATVRKLAAHHAAITYTFDSNWHPSRLTRKWHNFRATVRLLVQAFRFPITLLSVVVWLVAFLYGMSYILRFFLFIFAAYFVWTLLLDESFLYAVGLFEIVKPGIYNNKHDKFMSKLKDQFHFVQRPLNAAFGCWTGDLHTLLPCIFLASLELNLPYVRRWVRNEEDEESVAIDISFPFDNDKQQLYHNVDKPTMCVLHGLNGSSRTSYIQRQVRHYNQAGHTVLVMNTRGYGGSFLIGNNTFHGRRLSDVHRLVQTAMVGVGNLTQPDLAQHTRSSLFKTHNLRYNFANCFTKDPMDLANAQDWQQMVCGAAFSMGGIILSNYVATFGRYSGLATLVAVSVSGNLHLCEKDFDHRRHWQGFLTSELKDMLFPNYLYALIEKKLDIPAIESSFVLDDFDAVYNAPISGSSDRLDYWAKTSYSTDNKVNNIVTKTLIIHPVDDPIINVDGITIVIDELVHEDDTIRNLLIYLPAHGGHLGNFTSWNTDWHWLADASEEFTTKAVAELKEQFQQGKTMLQ